MKYFRPVLLVTCLALLAACGKAPSTSASADRSDAPDAAASTVATAPPAPLPEQATDPVIAAVEESNGTEAPAPAVAKDIVLAADTPAAPKGGNWQYPEGEYYTTLTAAQGTSSPAGKIEVAEVFWYGCPHCYSLEPIITEWVGRLPTDVQFVRIPVMWNPTNEVHARVYYTAEALGKLPEINPAMFRAIHVDNRPMTEEKDIQALFAEAGVPAEDFNKTYRSFSVESQLKRAKDLTAKYKVKGVPLLIVNGKYKTDGPQIKSQQDMLAVTEELIQKERQRS
jgi:protein dithiol oxidoreductase (disulfide-forming)